MPPAFGTIAVGALLQYQPHPTIAFRASLLANVHGSSFDASHSAKQHATT
jgi:hypothetical protein